MKIRSAERADAEAIGSLIVPIQRDEFGIAISYADQPDLAAIEDFYQTGKGGFWVAEAEGSIVGTIALKDIGSDNAALRKMFVHRDYRGNTHGIAAGLLDRLMQHAGDQQLEAIYLGTTSQFVGAHRFYEKNGFSLIDPADLPPGFPRMAIDSRFYRRVVAV